MKTVVNKSKVNIPLKSLPTSKMNMKLFKRNIFFKYPLSVYLQIGYLGIYGQKHPLFIGHNKIGRDPQTCHIVLKSHVST